MAASSSILRALRSREARGSRPERAAASRASYALAVELSGPTRSSRSTPARGSPDGGLLERRAVRGCERLERISDRRAAKAEAAQEHEHPGRPGGGVPAVRGVGGVRDHHERGDARRDRPSVGHEATGEHRLTGVDRDRRVVGRHRRETEAGEVLEGRRNAPVEQTGGECRRALRCTHGQRREAAALRCDERAGNAGHVGDGSEVDVDAELLERGRGLATAPADRAFGEPPQLVGSGNGRRPAEAPHETALLVGRDQDPTAARTGGCSQARRQRTHLGRRAGIRAHQDHASDPPRANPLE